MSPTIQLVFLSPSLGDCALGRDQGLFGRLRVRDLAQTLPMCQTGTNFEAELEIRPRRRTGKFQRKFLKTETITRS